MEKKTLTIIGALAVLVVVVVLAQPYISGNATYARMPTTVPIYVEIPEGITEPTGWAGCIGLADKYDALDTYCKQNGFGGIMPIDARPCLFTTEPTSYGWDGAVANGELQYLPLAQAHGEKALSAVKCVPA